MKQSNVTFQYKGNRDYIHGTDMFNMFLSKFEGQNIDHIRFSVHGFVKQVNCDVYQSTIKSNIDSLQGLEARCQVRSSDETQYMGLKVSDAKSLDSGRYPYDEDELIKLCEIKDSSIVMATQSPFTFIETIVAMKKRLMEAMFPDVDGKWVFTRIDLPVFCNATFNLEVKFKHNMNFKLIKSDILVDGEKMGDLYFSLVKS